MIIFIMAFIGAITPGPDILLVLQATLLHGLKRAVATLCGIATGWCIYLGILYVGVAHFLQATLAQIPLSAFGVIYLAYLSFMLFTKSANNIDFISAESASKNCINSVQDSTQCAVDSMDSGANSTESARQNIAAESAQNTTTQSSINTTESSHANTTPHKPLWRDYVRGLVINISNPKAIIFFSVIVAPFMDKNMLANITILFCGLSSAFILVIALGMYFRRFVNNALFNMIDKICAVLFACFSIVLLWRIIELGRTI